VALKYIYGGSIPFGTKILDPSAGWGDRLIASHCLGVHYDGVDPNRLLFTGYRQIISFFKIRNVRLYDCDFLDFKSNTRYDCVVTSPPYFNMEIYSNDLKQSSRFKTETTWLNCFLKPYVHNACIHLRIGGVIIIAINSKKYSDETYVYDMISYLDSIGMSYRGVIPYGERRNITSAQPMFVWEKKCNIKPLVRGITLRKITMDDIEFMAEVQQKPEVMKYVGSGNIKDLKATTEQVLTYISQYDNQEGRFYIIEGTVDNKVRPLGWIGYHVNNLLHESLRGKKMMRIVIDEMYQSMGIGTKAFQQFINTMREDIYTLVPRASKRSIKLLKKNSTKLSIVVVKSKEYILYVNRSMF
jgi:RimJ/RimL family protein N-acetyltransferase